MGSSPVAAGLLLLHWGPSRAPVQTERAERREGSFRERQTAKESMRVEEIFDRVVARFIGTKHERDIKRITPLVAAINALEPEMQRLSDAEMLAKTQDLKALAGRGVHIVTVNDYLARRDAEWMGPIYRALGLTVGVIVHDLDDTQRRAAYAADITYGTNNEFGFDYLRDNMKYDLADCVQRGHQFAIVDEVDSILIDEARTPLIISGPAEESTDKYYRIDKIIPKLIQDIDFTLDEKHRTATLTEEGISKCERLLSLGNLYDPAHMETIHHVYQALRAHTLYKRDVDYVVKDGEVIIVDEFTGRQMPGRRWSDGLHQAVEAKEAVKIERENQTLATITFQNYFRMYKKLSGMTGTAETEAAEFIKIYNLDVVAIPTNRQLIRHEHPDVVYRTETEKFEAVVDRKSTRLNSSH